MIPQTRHYVDRAVIYDHFEEHFQDKADFMKSVTSTMWNAHGSEYFSNITWVAGSSFGSVAAGIFTIFYITIFKKILHYDFLYHDF